MGQNAVAGANASSQNYANQSSNLLTQQGNAEAAGTVGVANAISGGISGASNDLMSAYMMSQIMKPANQSGYIPAGSV
jgi:hypothetical protein